MVSESLLATLYLLVGVLTTLLGLVILRENPGVRLNRVTALMLFFAGVGALLGAGSLWVEQAGPGSSLLRSSLVTNFAYLWEFFFPSLLLFAALFPQEQPLLRRHGWGDLVLFLPHTVHFFLMFFATIWGTGFGLENVSERIRFVGVLLSVPRVLLQQFYTWHRQLFSLVDLAYVASAVFLIARNLARTRNVGLRNQLRTILAGIGLAVVLYGIAVPLNLLLDLRLSGVVSSALLVGALAACAGTIAYAIVRYRFLDVRWIVRRTILYAVASAVIVGIYLQVVRRLGGVLSEALLVPPGVLDWVALVVPLVFFQPVMGRLEEALEGWILRGRRELRHVLARLSEQMSLSLDFDRVAQGLVHELPDALTAVGGAVLLRSDADTKAYRSVASRGFDAETLGLLQKLSPHLPEVASPGHPHAAQEWVEAARRCGGDLREIEERAGVQAPQLTYELRHGGERLGLYLLGAKASGMHYRGEEIALLATLANQAGVALKNSFLHRENLGKAVLEEELALARKIQQAFLPTTFPVGSPVEVHGLNLPSKQVGGDYYDFFPVAEGRYAVAIADVAGKGVPAALLASMLQASLRALLREGAPAGHVMERVNRLVCDSTNPAQFITLVAGYLDPKKLELTYCNAGHNYPIHARPGRRPCLLERSDLVLGVDEGVSYKEHRVALQPGDSLLFYTDGVTEARTPDGEDFGEDRLGQIITAQQGRAAGEVVRQIRDQVLRFAATRDPQDDMTLLYIRVPPDAAGSGNNARPL